MVLKYNLAETARPNMLDNSVFSPLMSRLLARRGLNDTQVAEIFLAPDYDGGLHDPMLMMDMDKACARIVAAIGNVERIVIYNDYDCDGIPGGVILHDFFRKIGYENFTNYIPHRFREGYGLNTGAIDQFVNDGVGLIITVDCGITDSEEVLYASERGVDRPPSADNRRSYRRSDIA
jgi:single-stranded-DNA-specific exonuclease